MVGVKVTGNPLPPGSVVSFRVINRHAETTTYGVMTGLLLPVYSGGPATSRQCKEAPMNEDTVGGYAVPVDPMDLLQCDSCQ